MDLAERSINSATWNFTANLIIIPVGIVQSILLARLLPVEYFGIVAGVIALITLVNQFFQFGLESAYMHRTTQTEDEIHALNVLYTLRFLLSSARVVFLLLIGLIFFSDLRQMVLIVLAVMTYLSGLVNAPVLLMTRRVKHGRLAFMRVTNTILVAAFSILIAANTGSIWALLIFSVVSFFWTFILLHVWRPVWHPRLTWDIEVMKYYLTFGGRVQINHLLSHALNTIDDIWTNINLGDLALGYYSRAYKFAIYPRMVLAAPIGQVAAGTYSELKNDRLRLSSAFFRVNTFMVRSGFLLGGTIFLIAPEFILIFLGERWLPMLTAFQLLLIFTLLDPMKDTISNAIVALGMPEKLIGVRVLQLIVLILGLFVLGSRYYIEGVAITVNIMMIVGILYLLRIVRPYVDGSYWKLFFAPSVALIAGFVTVYIVLISCDRCDSVYLTGLIKVLSFGISYMLLLFLIEGRELYQSLREIVNMSGIRRLNW